MSSGLPKVSIVIPNLNGKEHLRGCLDSILKLDYPQEKIEVVIVDNNSTDGSVEFLRKNYPWVRLIVNEKNEGFAKPSNDGARKATGDFVAFINNDMRVQKSWLIELVKSLAKENAVCAGSVILDWNGKHLDFAGGSVSFYGMGYQYDFKAPMAQVEPGLREDKEIFFACGGAMIVERKIFLSCGGFDEDYFAYFEDVDLGWRLRVLGYKIILSVKSRVYHRHHSTGARFAMERMWVLYERNKLYTIYKNYGEELLQKAFWPTILMDMAIIYERSGIRREDFDLRLTNAELPQGQLISNLSAARICAAQDFIKNIDRVSAKRRQIQQNRKTDDSEIIPFITDPFICQGRESEDYNKYKYQLIKTFGIDKAFGRELKRKVLLVCGDKLGAKMAGPAIRYYEFAKVLSKTCEVFVASYGESDLVSDNFTIFSYTYDDTRNLIHYAKEADIIVYQGFVGAFCEEFSRIAATRFLIIDLYDPYLIENVEIFKDKETGARLENYNFSLKTLNEQLESGDFFLCANEKQRDYWIGMLSALDRMTPDVYDLSRSGEKIIDVVPFGLSDKKPHHTRDVLKGVWPGINPDDKVIIWGGGVWNWFDPLTLIRAVKLISEKRNDVKLFFMGVKSPNPDVPEMKMLNDAVELSKSLGLFGTSVIFNFGWVDYEDRQNFLLESDIGVSCHFATLETRFSFRTRILDYLWAGLPIVCTKGDHFAKLVEKENLGIVADYKNVEQLADAITTLLDDKQRYNACRANVERVSEDFKWSKVVKPLEDFCENPVHSVKPVRAVEAAQPPLASAAERGHSGRTSVMARLAAIEENQQKLNAQLRSDARTERENNEILNDIQKWTYMMNNRFNRFKKVVSPLAFFRRLFRRKK